MAVFDIKVSMYCGIEISTEVSIAMQLARAPSLNC